MAEQSPSSDPLTAFGPNEWLVDELYEQYTRDKNSVDKAWWSFFADYEPGDAAWGGRTSGRGTNGKPAGTSAAPEKGKAAPAKTAPVKAEGTKGTTSAPASTAKAGAAPERKAAQAPQARSAQPEAKKADAPAEQKAPSPTPREPQAPKESGPLEESQRQPIRGASARVVTNMEASLEVPTATSVRAVPAKLLVDNRIVINNHLARSRGGKVSFTHIIGYALVKALAEMPEMNNGFTHDEKGKPVLIAPAHVNLGLAIDLARPDGSRQLVVPSIKAAETMDFAHFWTAYEEVVKKARAGKLTVEDFQGTTISLTNPGTIGTVHSVPRLMQGQGAIIGVGAMDYPAEWQGASEETLNRNAVSKILTLTSTYDHRIIQGAQSGDFLRLVHNLLLGEHGLYDEIFESLRIPYEPIRWVRDVSATHDDDINKVARVQELIHAYRVRGHLMADTDPLEYKQRRHPDLDITNHGLTLWDLDRDFATGGFGGRPFLRLRKILGILRDSYCRTVGVEYMHIQDPEQRRWIQDKVEVGYAKATREEQLRIVRRLNAAEAFETFLQTKFVGQKRFSLEGGESVIALLDRVLSRAAEDRLDEVCIGMPHRGRLNVLANIAGKSYGQIFREFEGRQDPKSVQGSGDVKYHLGTEGEFTAESGETTKVYLAANPSHLEAVNPVLEGIVRAKQDRLNLAGEDFTVLPVLLHGDAAFAGQGVVAETLNLSQLRGYRTGGTVHVVINNQVGFTTSPSSSRSSTYSTDVARMIQAPIFHVNGDDPEACVRVAELAYEFRKEFHKDVVIDLVCYRRRGHNEGDDPSMTQPLMYNLIEAKRSVRKLYTEALIGRGDITVEDAEAALRDYQQQLERVFVETKEALKSAERDAESGRPADAGSGLEPPAAQAPYADRTSHSATDTAISLETMHHIGDAFSSPPPGFTVHPKLRQMLDKRTKSTREGGIDWGTGELLAFGSLLMENTPVRLCGQDTRRGTFVSRHAVLIDKENASEWTPLLYLGNQARFWVYDSLLSEFAAMGFEYGYSVERPDALVLWEAQFGDFFNGAQTVIDEFISSGEQKWGQRSSVVLLLPHGYEGQGPDHSSGRIERFLTMCAEGNMTVSYPSTPASYFHLLRRQAYARPRKPLIVFTPKSMLRMKAAASSVEDFTSGTFRPVLPDREGATEGRVTRVLLAAGKAVYDLEAERERRGDTATAVLRLEQYYPVPGAELAAALADYPEAEVVVVQDEPENMGAWPFLALNLPEALAAHGEERPIRVVSRPRSASPAAGSTKQHQAEQADLVARAFDR
ncbi:multifunctional oxoglutarate decarboxylase/oxoglutarate dehydrogenase thiamine pyrophosphate-binding subunit/dihydrolipoyllysine-residue succinyltransferase subunit [Phycicoccus endophyticus]|uniref:Multifunctional oxoglutarate decarboxylase/oxoglutarate dehydrogenase thiamine pyrophosphate-binding subunit/dihydrolipoyllysine-residue succinyltransferase subunit n=1 Tax=Phycicoccus endophyticus TaxID=1690220 RepID=A0A7G9QYP6_9MICO|nr:multifunctional oxoglutarate decarboxylase/oxoglutarate dehydrogenase thiamine pyrophosphate-binding subunit/dihydrolipoyllysine-residue succinyltransferase subunit [Phycicoccus endophyticus]NHI20492.1 multifunctional oxoglutarate decarboxylase/oxoglutarate dehydrogenase thiamine pyrophosphate-binding subunit/dihydrolipoyllysine-residue succinyltransferase subunit [Phycicoccus endophyticus]QNN48471.1 multifunctional oxoglutarate decarboxylase/oxoglutarate dehydrogenase thiamine pyrophosphate-b